MPEKFFYFNREDFPDMPPLDTESGQKYINSVIEALGGVDIVIFDNIQALTIGELREPESWRRVLPWVRSLTMRLIGQIWIHHTGHNEDHGYGDKTREWQLDTTMLMERVEQLETDIAFSIKFDKARERTPDNRGDFEPAVITLANDEWTSERGNCARPKRVAKDRALELLGEAISHEGFIPPACAHIPYNTPCVTEDIWRRYCKAGCISDSSDPEAVRKAFSRAAKKLVGTTVGKWTDLVWVIRP